MCSTSTQRIAEIGKAIDDLAAEARRGSANSGKATAVSVQAAAGLNAAAAGPSAAAAGPSAAPAEQNDGVVLRIAKLWEELAELDPEVAKRVATYQA